MFRTRSAMQGKKKWCTSPGEGFLLRGYIRCSSYKVLLQRPALALLGVMGGYRPLAWEDGTICSSQHGGWHESCQWQGMASCLVSYAFFSPLSPSHTESVRPYRPTFSSAHYPSIFSTLFPFQFCNLTRCIPAYSVYCVPSFAYGRMTWVNQLATLVQ